VIRRVAVAGALLALAGSASAGPGPLIAAHRGGAGLWPENSLAAFRGAIELGVDALEFDVHLTADGEPVVIHDATLERTTTGRGPVRDGTRASLATVRLRGLDGTPTDARVPTLAEVLDVAAPARVEVLPEVKSDVSGAPYDGLEARVLEALAARGLSRRAVVQSFDPTTLTRVLARTPSARTMLLVSRTRLGIEGISAADAVRRAAGLGATDIGLDHRLVDARVVAAARAAGVRLSVWTVNEESDLLRARELGVDLVMTDRPDVARRLFGRR
jgi:glycerophosphoryl diester phosphodiesterase